MAANIPEGYQQVMPYLMLKGTNKFIEFMEKTFDAKVTEKHMNEDQTIRHGQITVGKSVIMFGEAQGEWLPIPGSLFVYVESADETFKRATDAGATVVMGLTDQEYGRTCGVKDPCDNAWWITSIAPSQPPPKGEEV
jgi:PhnB protein